MQVKNWRDFQHYSKRCPPWIKLHKKLLDDKEYSSLPDKSAKYLPLLWLLASESADGKLPAIDVIAFRLRLDSKDVEIIINDCKHWISVDASNVLAECKQNHVSETETETETETEAETEADSPNPDSWMDGKREEPVQPINQKRELEKLSDDAARIHTELQTYGSLWFNLSATNRQGVSLPQALHDVVVFGYDWGWEQVFGNRGYFSYEGRHVPSGLITDIEQRVQEERRVRNKKQQSTTSTADYDRQKRQERFEQDYLDFKVDEWLDGLSYDQLCELGAKCNFEPGLDPGTNKQLRLAIVMYHRPKIEAMKKANLEEAKNVF